MLREFDKKVFEYVHHLHLTGKTTKDLSFEDHNQCDSNIWQFPKWQETYYQTVFLNFKHILENKTVLDVGCGLGDHISWFESCGVKELTNIDNNPSVIPYAKICGNLVKMKTSCYVASAEDFKLEAQTIYMLGVNQGMKKQKEVYKTLKCDDLIIDSNSRNIAIDELIASILDCSFVLKKLIKWTIPKDVIDPNRINLKYILHFKSVKSQ